MNMRAFLPARIRSKGSERVLRWGIMLSLYEHAPIFMCLGKKKTITHRIRQANYWIDDAMILWLKARDSHSHYYWHQSQLLLAVVIVWIASPSSSAWQRVHMLPGQHLP